MTKSAYRFRPVQEWKSAMMNLPSFFELMRSIFGNIKTPYNKQKLMDDLVVFLSRDDIRKTISSYIDHEDCRIIAAAALLGDPPPDELEDFLRGQNPATLRGSIMNLEERLILFRYIDETQTRRIGLNPVIEPVLDPITAETGILFPCEDADNKTAENVLYADDRFLGALIAFLSGDEDFFKADGIRKKVQDQAKKLFPEMDLEKAAGALKSLGLFYPDGEKFIPDNRKMAKFAEVTPAERREYWAAGFYLNMNEKDSGLLRNQPQHIADIMHKFCCSLDPAKRYPETTLKRLIKLLEPDGNRNYWNPAGKINAAFFLNALEEAKILAKCGVAENAQTAEKNGNEWRQYIPPAVQTGGPVIAMDSAFTFVLYPGISFRDIMKLAVFSGVRDNAPYNFEITRNSAVRAFDLGLNSKDMTKTLSEFSGNPPDESLVWTLGDWELRYNAVSLHEGLLLNLAEDRQYLAETEPVASMISRKLAPGLFLLSGTKSRAEAALIKAGVDIIAKPNPEQREQNGQATVNQNRYQYFNRIGNAFPPLADSCDVLPNAVMEEKKSPEETKNHFRGYLEKLRMGKHEKDELQARIERRVILTETQLEKAAFKYQKLEAKLLDYAGKIAIVKQAIADGSALEVTLPTLPEEGEQEEKNVTTGIPAALEKKGGENVLVLKPVGKNMEDAGDVIRIPLGKISLLRMIKQSIFSQKKL